MVNKKNNSLNNSESYLNIIAYVAILLIIVSFVFISLNIRGFTGRASTDYGYVNITIESSANINFTTDSIDFGAGQVSGGGFSALVNSNGVSENGTWNQTNQSLHLENIGNVNVSVDLTSDSDALTFIGGTNPGYQWNVSNNETNSCTPGITIDLDTYFNASTEGVRVCDVLNYEDSADSIFINVGLSIPSDSNTGNLSSIITATATTSV